MSHAFDNKVAIITGASKGIGLACAEKLAQGGAKVLLISRAQDGLQQACEKIRQAGGTAEFMAGDVADETLADKAAQKALSLWGRIDILLNNAGGPAMGSFLEHGEKAWESAINTNLLSVVRFSRAVAPHMIERKSGRIISITSTIAKEPTPLMVLSATARAGVSAFTKSIAIELAPHNITVNAICPGGVLTERLTTLMHDRAKRESKPYEDILKESQNSIPAGRFATPQEIAGVFAFLASDEGSYVNGVSLSVDGALTKAYS